jgi:hypothetical protein
MLKKQFREKTSCKVDEIIIVHVFECFEKEVKKDILPEQDLVSQVMGCRRECYVNLDSYFTF